MGLRAALLYGATYVAVGNERSANEGNVAPRLPTAQGRYVVVVLSWQESASHLKVALQGGAPKVTSHFTVGHIQVSCGFRTRPFDRIRSFVPLVYSQVG